MKNNLFIEALEIGIQKSAEGIQFDQLVDSLLGKYSQLETDFARSFIMWFYSKFDPEKNYAKIKQMMRLNQPQALLNEFSKNKSHITGDAYFMYLEYQELKEAREASLKAQNSSKNAIIISIIALGLMMIFSSIQILLSLFQ